MGNTYNFSGKTQFIQEVKDNVSITQNNYGNNTNTENKLELILNNFEEKFDSISLKLDESEISQEQNLAIMTNEIQNMLYELVSVIGSCFDKLDANEQKRFEDLKRKDDWESTLTLTVPLLDKIGIKIESKTKLENLKQKVKDQIELVKAKLRGGNSEAKNLESNKTKGQLEN